MDQSDLSIIQKDEFTIDIDKVNLIKETEDYLLDVFKVKCLLGDIVADDGKQWMEIQGSADKRSLAKDYIRALCNPVEMAEIKYPVELAELITGRELRYRIEKQSGVALRYEESGKVTIGGNDAVSVTVAYSMLEDIIGQHWDETREEASRKPKGASKRLDAELQRLSSENELEMESDFLSLDNTIKRVIIDVLKTDHSGKSSPSLDDYGIKPWFGPGAGNTNNDSPKQETSKGSVGLSDAAKQLKQIDLESFSDPDHIKQNKSSSSVTDDPGKYLKEFALDRGYSEELVENIFAAYGRDMNFALFFRALTGLVDIPKPKGAPGSEQSDVIDTTSQGAKEASSLDTNSLMANYVARLSKDHEEEVDILNLDELKKRNAERQRLLLQALEKRVGTDHKDSVVDLCGESVASDDRSDVVVDVDLTKDDLSDETDAHSSHRAYASGHRRAPYERHHEAYRSRSPLDHRMPDGPGSPRRAQKNGALGAVGTPHPSRLRHIVIDGSNVAMTHGNGKVFSCRGIDIVVDYFIRRGHKDITVFIPQWRTRTQSLDYNISDQHLLGILKEKGYLVLTPSRRIPGKNIVCYDDRYVIRLAQEVDGVIVSNDNYRDLWYERPDWREIIEYRLLMFSFVGDLFMPPDDPLGKDGPSLTEFLQKSQTQSEAGQNRSMDSQKSYVQHQPMRGPPPQGYRLGAPGNIPLIRPPPNLAWPLINPYAQDWPRPWSQIVRGMPPPLMNQPAKPRFSENFDSVDGDTNSSTAGNVSRPRNQGGKPGPRQASEWKQVLHKNQKPSFIKMRDEPTTRQLVQSMMEIFADCDEVIQRVLEDNPAEEDLNTLSDLVLNYMSNS